MRSIKFKLLKFRLQWMGRWGELLCVISLFLKKDLNRSMEEHSQKKRK